MVEAQIALSMLTICLYVGLSYLVGRLALALLAGPIDSMTTATAPVVGAMLFALQLWLYGVVHVPWNLATLLLPWLALGLIARRAYGRALSADWTALRGHGEDGAGSDRLDALLFVAGVIIAAFYLLKLVTQPVTGPDAIAMWLYKAKFAFDHQAFDLRSMASVPAGPTRHLDYPPLYPLTVATVYTLIGHVDDITGKAVNFLFLVSGVATGFTLVAKIAGRRTAVLVSFLLVALPFFSMALIESRAMGYADYELSILLLMSLAYLYRFERGDGPMAAALALLLAAFAGLTKNEGLVFLGIVAITVALLAIPRLRQDPIPPSTTWRLGALIALGIVPVLAWLGITRSLGFTSDLLAARDWHTLLPAIPGRAVTILRFATHSASIHNDYPWLAVGYVISAAVILFDRVRPGRVILIALSLQIASYFVVYLLTPYALNWHLATSFERVVLQVVPSLVVLGGIAASRPAF